MAIQWRTVDVPMGRGLDTKTAPAAQEPGASLVDSNVEFLQSGGRQKRKGFGTQLGTLTNGQRLLRHRDHLLAQAGGQLWDWSPAAGTWASAGAFRAVPCRPTVVKNSSVSITNTDSFSLGGYTLTVWTDSTGVAARITDNATGAVVTTKTAMFSAGACIKAFGMLHSGFPQFYVLAGGSGWRWNSQGGIGWDITPTVLAGAIGTVTAIAAAANGTHMVLFWAGTTHTASADLQFDFTAGLWGRTYSAATATSPACLSLNGAFFCAGYNSAADSVLHGLTFSATTGLSIDDAAITTTPAGHVTCALVPGTSNTAYLYDIANYVGTTQSRVMAQVFDSGGFFGVITTEFTLFRSVSLASDAGSNIGLIGSNQLYFVVQYNSAATNSISGTEFSQVLQNTATFVVSFSGAVVGRVFRGQSITQSNTASFSKDSSGNLVFGFLALVFSDSTTAQGATTFGGAALVRVEAFQENARGVSSLQEYFAVGGSPSVFDGAHVVEAGFHLFPEVLQAGTASPYAKGGLFNNLGVNVTNAPNSTISRTNLTAVVLGTRMNGKSSGVAASQVWGHIYIAVTSGVTGAASPGAWSVSGGLIVDGTVIWQDAGIQAPQGAWAAGLTPAQMFLGRNITSSSGGNGFVYTVIAVGGGNTATDPFTGAGWPTVPGTSTGVLADGYNYMCIGAPGQLTPADLYSYLFTYEWVDDQGLLHTSAPSPALAMTMNVGTDPTTANALLCVSTLRVTAKLNVRIGVYRTVGNGLLCQKIMVLANNTAVDAIAFVDTVPDTTAALGLPIYCGPLGAGQLPNVPPPSCTTAAVVNSRVFVNSRENPYTIWPSKLVQLNSVYSDVPAWSDELPIQVDASWGEVQVLAEMDGKLIVFQDRRISIGPSDGPDNNGGGADFLPPQPIATAEVGCTNPDSVVLTDAGLMFQSAKGIYLLTRDGNLKFIGAELDGVDGQPITAAVNVPASTQVAFLDANWNLFIYDYYAGAWSQWTVTTTADGFSHLVAWNGSLVGIDDNNPAAIFQQGFGYSDWNATAYGVDVLLPGITNGLGKQPFLAVRKATLQAVCDTPTGFTLSVYENRATAATYATAAKVLPAGRSPLQLLFRNPKLKAMGLRITETAPGIGGVLIDTLELEIGVKPGTYPVPTANRTS